MTDQNHPLGVAQAAGDSAADQLRQALEPFAKISLWRDMYPDAKEDFLAARQLQGFIRVEDVRRARDALTAQPPATVAQAAPEPVAWLQELELRAVQFSSQWGAGGKHAKMMAAFAAQEIAAQPPAAPVETAAADVIERVARERTSDPATDDLTVPLAIQLAELEQKYADLASGTAEIALVVGWTDVCGKSVLDLVKEKCAPQHLSAGTGDEK